MEDTPKLAEPSVASGYELLTEQELEARAKLYQKSFIGSVIPVLRIEMSRFLVMSAAFSIIAFVYTFLRVYKDNVIYSVLEPAAQNYLKFFTFFASFILVGCINKLLVYYDIDKTFEIGTIGFVIMLGIMAFLIRIRGAGIQHHPLWATKLFIMDTATCRGLRAYYMLALIFNHWVLSLFYVICEVLGSIMVGYFFMTYVNSHCTADQNKRFVRILYICSNIFAYVAGELMKRWSRMMRVKDVAEVEKYYVTFTIIAAILFLVVLALKKVLDHIFRTNPLVIPSVKAKKSKSKKSVSFMDGVYYAAVSRLLRAMCLMTLFYNIVNALVSSLFTNANKATASVLNLPTTYGSGQKSIETQLTAIATIVVLLSPVSKLFEWFGVASSGGLPVMIAFVGTFAACLMACINYPAGGEDNMFIARWLGDLPKHPKLEAWVDLLTVSAVKISKYAFFDIVKEAISMKINPEIRPLFKGVFDGLCGKLGKFIGAAYGIVMENLTGGVLDARYFSPVTFIFVTILVILWAMSVYYLHYSYKKSVETNTFMSPDYIEGSKLKDE